MTKATNYLATVTDVNSEFPAKGAPISNSNRCVIKDETGQTIGSVGATNNWYIDQSAQPFASYINPRLPRWQDLVQTTTTTTTTMPTVVGSAFIDTLFSSPSGVAEIGARLYQSTSGTTGFNTYVTISSDNTQRHIASNQTLATDSYLVAGYAVSIGGGSIRFNRFGVNIFKLKTDYPAINIFTFDLYVARLNNSFDGYFTIRNSIKFSNIINTANNNGVDFTSAQSEGAFTDTPTKVCNFANTYVKVGYFTYIKSANTFDYTDLQGTGCIIQPNSNVTITALNGLDLNSFTVYIDGNADTGWKSGTRSYPAGTIINVVYSSPACGVTRNGSAYTSNTNVTLSGGVAQSFSLNNANSWTTTGYTCIGNVQYTNQVNPCGGTQQFQTYPGSSCDCICNQNCNGTYYGPNVCGGAVGLPNDLIRYSYYSCNNNPTGSYELVQNCSCSCNQACNGTYQGQPYCSGNERRVDNYFSCNNAYESTTIISACSCDCNQACSGEYWGDPYCDGTGIQKRNRKYVCNNANTGQVETISTCSQACGAFVAPIWTPVGDPTCDGCYQKQDEVQSNVCCPDPPQGTPRTIELGTNTACGTWDLEYYCIGYEKWSRLRNSCVDVTCCNTFIEANSPYCGYVPPPACRTYQIIGYNSDEYVDGTYTNCAGYPDSFSFYGGPGTVGSVCAQPSSVYITSGNGAANDVGGC